MTKPNKQQLWEAINKYAESCGGNPQNHIYGNTKRQIAVAEIEALVYPQDTCANPESEEPVCLVCNGVGGHEEGCHGTSAYHRLFDSIIKLRIEINCRIEHGADSNGHLEYVQDQLDNTLKNANPYDRT